MCGVDITLEKLMGETELNSKLFETIVLVLPLSFVKVVFRKPLFLVTKEEITE